MHLVVQIIAMTAVAVAALFYLKGPEGAFVDLFLTADQQAQQLYDDKQFREAAEKFEDPWWKGTAQYASGQYLEAAESFVRMANAEGFFNRGNAFMRGREYRKAVTSYEQAVADAPVWVEAQENLELARYTIDYIERSREQGDTGEKSGIGADEVVYDNDSERGSDTEVTRESAVQAQSADKWMRSVNTETADFLRSRFLLEASRRGEL
jgi:Ca-activated chloride channel family protein